MTTALLAVDQLTIDYRHKQGGAVQAVKSLSFRVNPGEVVALVGGSGSGKSTTAAALVGLLSRQALRRAGSIAFNGQALENASQRQWQQLRGLDIGFVPQDPAQALNPIQTIAKQMQEALTLHNVPKKIAAARLPALLAEVGLNDSQRVLASYPHQLSGGMRQRVLLAMAMCHQPQLIIADEPTSALDVSVQKQVLDALAAVVANKNIALILITHDLNVALERADRVLVMHEGQLVESGTPASLLRQTRHPYTRLLLEASPAFLTVPYRQPPDAGLPLMQVKELSKQFVLAGGATFNAVDQVSFPLIRGGTTSLAGESGSGKSTTVRMLAGLEHPDGGQIEFDGTLLSAGRSAEFRRRVQMVYQNPYASLNPKMTLEAIITEPLRAFRLGNKQTQRERAAELLAAVELPVNLLTVRPSALSGGQRQRVAIARALAISPELLILDEPVSALDVAVQAQILALLDRLQREHGLTYLFISHDLAVVRQISDYVVIMQQGKVVEQGEVASIFTTPSSAYTRQLLAHIPGTFGQKMALYRSA
ncbi:ABC transporter ATP-binding protein [Erwiniaceae bacterium BAC15a-03b]|uniref:ABC transporter ATP-binding protein n=1 Tax=Winslowiella arboricola TaxID=2978220 RepID=A0A9J6PN41_9GAMM|nr:ABC transporter ATP-binding protein [Winslowiella arboricola]MCU5772477.1 ABC transporter ATP-binding protein [Winslowiella arboricola]MCU5779729.1 ABC transporter ATP-binding protein [Winslowiella arboricola]